MLTRDILRCCLLLALPVVQECLGLTLILLLTVYVIAGEGANSSVVQLRHPCGRGEHKLLVIDVRWCQFTLQTHTASIS